jgi:hypothetical protein
MSQKAERHARFKSRASNGTLSVDLIECGQVTLERALKDRNARFVAVMTNDVKDRHAVATAGKGRRSGRRDSEPQALQTDARRYRGSVLRCVSLQPFRS